MLRRFVSVAAGLWLVLTVAVPAQAGASVTVPCQAGPASIEWAGGYGMVRFVVGGMACSGTSWTVQTHVFREEQVAGRWTERLLFDWQVPSAQQPISFVVLCDRGLPVREEIRYLVSSPQLPQGQSTVQFSPAVWPCPQGGVPVPCQAGPATIVWAGGNGEETFGVGGMTCLGTSWRVQTHVYREELVAGRWTERLLYYWDVVERQQPISFVVLCDRGLPVREEIRYLVSSPQLPQGQSTVQFSPAVWPCPVT